MAENADGEKIYKRIYKLEDVEMLFRRDCKQIIERYVELKTFAYTKFAELWKDMKFGLVFAYSKLSQYHVRKTQVFLFEAKKFFVFGRDLYYMTGALYLLYGLYYKQPFRKYAKIRITRSENDILVMFLNKMRESRNVEVLYVYSKLNRDEAFSWVYTQSPLSPEQKLSSRHFQLKDDTFEANIVDEIDKQFKKIMEDQNIEKLFKQYNLLKVDFVESTGDTSISKFESTIQDQLRNIFQSSIADGAKLEGTISKDKKVRGVVYNCELKNKYKF